MQVKFSGSIHYANGDPISNVVVRIFDKDAAGRQDDDLTVTPGLSDEQGRFEPRLRAPPLPGFSRNPIPWCT